MIAGCKLEVFQDFGGSIRHANKQVSVIVAIITCTEPGLGWVVLKSKLFGIAVSSETDSRIFVDDCAFLVEFFEERVSTSS